MPRWNVPEEEIKRGRFSPESIRRLRRRAQSQRRKGRKPVRLPSAIEEKMSHEERKRAYGY